ncbi:hypothetical protein FACS189429_0870 [Bacteroidia bacterium]|nr:hypothetical protein FACS189429_0870 [Bacteroidia bacterium]
MQKTLQLWGFLLWSVCCCAQVQDDFSDGNFTENPVWTGTTENFWVNSEGQLQSKATQTSVSWLFTPSQAIDDAVWQADVRINYPTSGSNYASIYLISNIINPDSCEAYYVQIGGTNDEISLFVQHGTKKTKIIDGTDKRTDVNPLRINIKVTRDSEGNFQLFSKKSDESDYFFEGTANNTSVASSNYFGLAYHNTNTTGNFYIFDNVNVTGEKATEPKSYKKPQYGDILWNEVMCNVAENLAEYVEIVNLTADTLDISGVSFTTLKTNGSYNTLVHIPPATILLPNGYAAFCSDRDALYTYFDLSEENAKIYSTARWNTLNNEGATLVLLDENGEDELDIFPYSAKWHHPLVGNAQNVSLEKINPSMSSQTASSWHSAASEVRYGTPGYKNSQLREFAHEAGKNLVWLETEHFSPDNDGFNDLCYIHYATNLAGNTANVMIFDAVGNNIKHLCDNILLSSDGYLVWDGTKDNGKLANAAVYLLYFQFFNANTAQKQEVKLPLVLTMR